jgi:hypothetical protein
VREQDLGLGLHGKTDRKEQDPLKRAGSEWSFEEAIARLEEMESRWSTERDPKIEQCRSEKELATSETEAEESIKNVQKETKEQQIEEDRSTGISWGY